jgi:hypothetical protein
MRSARKPDPTTDPKSARAAAPPPLAVPRGWLVVVIALLVVPWLVVGALYLRSGESPETPEPVGAAPSRTATAGPWGNLTVAPVVVSPPLEYVAADWGRTSEPDTWYFPETSLEQVEAFLISTGLSREQAARLRAATRPQPGIRGIVISPDLELVRSIDPEVRSRLYTVLAKSALNFDQTNSFRFLGTTADDWLGGSLISPRTRQLVEPFLYRDGEFMHFADPEAIRTLVGDTEELRRLAKTLLRQATVLVRLTVDNSAQVEALSDYWGRGGRRLDLRPLLESVSGAGQDHSIDIVHLLPTFARLHLYRYPKLTTADYNKPLLANCLWTSLNFFGASPDDRFLDVNVALETLRRDYYVVEHGYQLGDIVGFVDDEGDLIHVAVYIADDLVFTKNGTSPMAPWTIVSLDYLKGYYRRRADDLRLIYHRRNDS